MLLYNQITSLNSTNLKKRMLTLLKEDVSKGDATTNAVISKNQIGEFVFKSREKMIFCGGPIIMHTFSSKVKVKLLIKEGQQIQAKTTIAIIKGSVREILTKERLILNMIQRLSGISSNTKKFVLKLNNPQIKILDTRKTTPGLRLLEKYAVNKGGGYNHRLDLSSGVMIKDNHINNNKNIEKKLKTLKNKIPIQLEIDTIEQINQENINIVDAILLDNMPPTVVKKCIEKINRLKKKDQTIFIEVSGGINLKSILKYNINGVHGISIGALTHQSRSKDISLDSI